MFKVEIQIFNIYIDFSAPHEPVQLEPAHEPVLPDEKYCRTFGIEDCQTKNIAGLLELSGSKALESLARTWNFLDVSGSLISVEQKMTDSSLSLDMDFDSSSTLWTWKFDDFSALWIWHYGKFCNGSISFYKLVQNSLNSIWEELYRISDGKFFLRDFLRVHMGRERVSSLGTAILVISKNVKDAERTGLFFRDSDWE
ncbi:hypothetical protein RhiirB3_475498 [Rhizophagus irregularis]|nr:hypothetical protein RhiirB3_490474 [Rhizophagus irregularis]PKY32375.1 hypothetical protein RhiirB3_475498 [Rhizophagus irregularis]